MCQHHEAMVPVHLRLHMIRVFRQEGYPGELAHPSMEWLHALKVAIEAVTQREAADRDRDYLARANRLRARKP